LTLIIAVNPRRARPHHRTRCLDARPDAAVRRASVRVMRTEPPPCQWAFPPPDAAGPDGLLAIGADLEPGTLLAAYRSGVFPMPLSGVRELTWFSPDPRAVVPLGEFRPSRSLRRSARRFTVTADMAFADVVAGCADPRRPGGWITPAIRAAYERLHALGWAHSLEVWDDGGALAGGLYGVEVGGLFAAESKFHRRTDASKVALAALVERLRAAGGERLLDVQWATPHLRSLGARDIARADYLRRLERALQLPPAF
jgi:leucyl/phenylalanyl-tRNA---protein transferase